MVNQYESIRDSCPIIIVIGCKVRRIVNIAPVKHMPAAAATVPSTGSRRCSKFFVSDSVVCAALSAVSDCSVTVSVWADVSSEVAASV